MHSPRSPFDLPVPIPSAQHSAEQVSAVTEAVGSRERTAGPRRAAARPPAADGELAPASHAPIIRMIGANDACGLAHALSRPGGREAALQIRDNRGGTALHIAAERGAAGVVAVLARLGARQLWNEDQDGALPLHRALGWDEAMRENSPAFFAEASPEIQAASAGLSLAEVFAQPQTGRLAQAAEWLRRLPRRSHNATVRALLIEGEEKANMVESVLSQAMTPLTGEQGAVAATTPRSPRPLVICALTISTLRRDAESLSEVLAWHRGGQQMRHALMIDGYVGQILDIVAALEPEPPEASLKGLRPRIVAAAWRTRRPEESLAAHVVRLITVLAVNGDWTSIERIFHAMERGKRTRQWVNLEHEGHTILAMILRHQAPMPLVRAALGLGARVQPPFNAATGKMLPLLAAAGLGVSFRKAFLLFTDAVEPLAQEEDAGDGPSLSTEEKRELRATRLADTAWDLADTLPFRRDVIDAMMAEGADPFRAFVEQLDVKDAQTDKIMDPIFMTVSLLDLAVLGDDEDLVERLIARPEAEQHPKILGQSLQIVRTLRAGLASRGHATQNHVEAIFAHLAATDAGR